MAKETSWSLQRRTSKWKIIRHLMMKNPLTFCCLKGNYKKDQFFSPLNSQAAPSEITRASVQTNGASSHTALKSCNWLPTGCCGNQSKAYINLKANRWFHRGWGDWQPLNKTAFLKLLAHEVPEPLLPWSWETAPCSVSWTFRAPSPWDRFPSGCCWSIFPLCRPQRVVQQWQSALPLHSWAGTLQSNCHSPLKKTQKTTTKKTHPKPSMS